MADLYRIVLVFHVITALGSWAAFWIALFLRKGGALHIRIGMLFFRGMIAMACSGAFLSLVLAWDPLCVHPLPASAAPAEVAEHIEVAREIGTELVLISILTLSLTWFGMHAVRRRRALSLAERWADVGAALALALAGVAALLVGARPGSLPHWEAFSGWGVVYLLVSGLQLRSLLWPAPGSWIVEHLAGTLGAGTLSNAALAVQIVPRFVTGFEGERMFLAAIPVTALGVFCTVIACLHYRRKFAGPRRCSTRRRIALQPRLVSGG